MANQHRIKGTTVRPEPDELADAKAYFPAGHSLESFLRACLRAVREEPEKVLALLGPYWPPEKPRGRPRKSEQPTT